MHCKVSPKCWLRSSSLLRCILVFCKKLWRHPQSGNNRVLFPERSKSLNYLDYKLKGGEQISVAEVKSYIEDFDKRINDFYKALFNAVPAEYIFFEVPKKEVYFILNDATTWKSSSAEAVVEDIFESIRSLDGHNEEKKLVAEARENIRKMRQEEVNNELLKVHQEILKTQFDEIENQILRLLKNPKDDSLYENKIQILIKAAAEIYAQLSYIDIEKKAEISHGFAETDVFVRKSDKALFDETFKAAVNNLDSGGNRDEIPALYDRKKVVEHGVTTQDLIQDISEKNKTFLNRIFNKQDTAVLEKNRTWLGTIKTKLSKIAAYLLYPLGGTYFARKLGLFKTASANAAERVKQAAGKALKAAAKRLPIAIVDQRKEQAELMKGYGYVLQSQMDTIRGKIQYYIKQRQRNRVKPLLENMIAILIKAAAEIHALQLSLFGDQPEMVEEIKDGDYIKKGEMLPLDIRLTEEDRKFFNDLYNDTLKKAKMNYFKPNYNLYVIPLKAGLPDKKLFLEDSNLYSIMVKNSFKPAINYNLFVENPDGSDSRQFKYYIKDNDGNTINEGELQNTSKETFNNDLIAKVKKIISDLNLNLSLNLKLADETSPLSQEKRTNLENELPRLPTEATVHTYHSKKIEPVTSSEKFVANLAKTNEALLSRVLNKNNPEVDSVNKISVNDIRKLLSKSKTLKEELKEQQKLIRGSIGLERKGLRS